MDVANFHNGVVPLHGRLFAQWLHHLFPHTCPYPHVAGTTRPRQAGAYTAATGEDHELSDEELRRYVDGAKRERSAGFKAQALPWVAKEELVEPAVLRGGGP